MATTTITALPAASALSGTEPIPVDQAGTTKKTTPAAIATYIGTLGGVQSTTVTLTAADLAVLDSVPFELVAAPGANKIAAFTSLSAYLQLNGGYGPGEGSANVVYGSDTNAVDVGTALANSFVCDSGGAGTTGGVENEPLNLYTSGSIPVPGAIATSSLNDGGIGYADNDTFTVDTGLGTLATGHVVSQTAGVVTAYLLDTTPNGYLVGTGVATTATSGVGTGLLIDIDTLDYSANPMTLTVKTLFSIMDV